MDNNIELWLLGEKPIPRSNAWCGLREGNRRWRKLADGVYSLCTDSEERIVDIQDRIAAIQASWDEPTRLSRLGITYHAENTPTLFVCEAPQIGPRESGEAADRQYHGDMWIHGEW